MRNARISLMLAVIMMVMGCSTLQTLINPAQTNTFNIQANAINDKAIADYNNSLITIYQRDAIRSILCDYQTAHNAKVNSGESEAELLKDFTAMQARVNAIYNEGVTK
jgi:hypothetical protein